MSDSAARDLIEHAHRTGVVVIGAGIAGLVAALECAKVGLAVTVLEAVDTCGGTIATAELDGLAVDVGADSFATDGAELSALIDELGLRGDVESPLPGTCWIAGAAGTAPLPADTILGIPANPWADDVRAVIGWAGAWRAYLDRLRPPLTIGHARSLGGLVRTRMGPRVADRLVAPLTQGTYGISPDRVDVDRAVPGLNSALTRTGSLAGAVAQLQAGSPRATLAGGLGGLVAALTARLGDLDAVVRTGIRVAALERVGDRWHVVPAPRPGDTRPGATGPGDTSPGDTRSGDTGSGDTGPGDTAPEDTGTVGADAAPIPADIVIVCTPEREARRLLAPHVAALGGDPVSPPDVDVVTLVVTAPALDAHPRGRSVFPVPGTATAMAVHHLTATWPDLAATAGPGRHVLRVELPVHPGTGREPGTDRDPGTGSDPGTDRDAVALALREAATLLGVALGPGDVRAAHRAVRPRALPASALDRDDAGLRAAVAAVPGLAVAGAWLGGSGLARTAADAIAVADGARSAALWGGARHDSAG